MSTSQHLLAKSSDKHKPERYATLLGHLQFVHAAAETISIQCGEAMLNAFGIPAHKLHRFVKVVTLAAALHDVGKANDHFQRIVRPKSDGSDCDYLQALRHEWVSWWWLHLPEVRDWARSVLDSPDDVRFVLCAIAGHHPKVNRPTPPEYIEGAGSKISFLGGHSEFRAIEEWLATRFPADRSFPRNGNVELRIARGLADDVVAAIFKQVNGIDSFVSNLNWDEILPWQTFCACAKACLVAADVSGSALSEKTSEAKKHVEWIEDALSIAPSPADLEQLVKERLMGHKERPFQSRVAGADSRVTLVTAACGSGKTVAAWLWAARQCPGQRVFLCYPTTGTATEGFRGYLFEDQTSKPKLGARLFHSRADIDFEVILNASDEEEDDESKIASLRAWGTPVVCCTVDTVLGIMQNQRRGLYAWPAIAQGAFVFDEIHAYDDELFGCLLQFLDKLKGLRVLLMTASLPTPRLKAIQEVLTDQNDELTIIGGPKELEELPRYRQITPEDIGERVRREVMAGGRVLWICNVVDRAMQVADVFEDLDPLIYHSRFRYEDRVKQHRAVVEAFGGSSTQGCLAVCTQVAEMSLDISSTLLVTEMCPVPSLIQRLGRLNRYARQARGNICQPETMPFIAIEPTNNDGDFQEMPYAKMKYGDWPLQTRAWLESLGKDRISQRTLAAAWEEMAAKDPVPALGDSTWIEGGPRTVVGSLRESSPSVTVVMPGEDAARVAKKKSDLARVAIPMPMPWHFRDWKSWRTRTGYIVPPAGALQYEPSRGAQWV